MLVIRTRAADFSRNKTNRFLRPGCAPSEDVFQKVSDELKGDDEVREVGEVLDENPQRPKILGGSEDGQTSVDDGDV